MTLTPAQLPTLKAAILAVAAALSFGAAAQSVTPAQLTTLRAFACADTGTARPLMVSGDANGLTVWFNSPSTYIVWKTSVRRDDVTGDGFDWTQADNLTTGQARIWDWLFDNSTRTINPSQPGVRNGISEAWKGTAGKLAVGTYILSQSKRPALRVEQALSTGTGTDATPGLMSREGQIGAATPVVFQDNGTLWGC